MRLSAVHLHMRNSALSLAIFAFFSAGAAEEPDKVDCGFSGSVTFGIASAGLSPSGGLYDTLPEATQVLDWRQGLGQFGYLCGFYSIYSSLHDRQHEVHRAAFNDMDGDVCYGYDVELADGVALQTSGGPYFDEVLGANLGSKSGEPVRDAILGLSLAV